MRNPYLYLGLLIAWIFAGAWFWNNATCCNISNPLSVKDGATLVAANSNNLRFALTTAIPKIPEEVKPELDKITTYLKAEPGRTLAITGLYEKEEENGTGFSSLGFGRAEAIKAYFVGQGISASRIFTSDQLQDNLIVDDSEVVGPLAFDIGSRGISIRDGEKFGAADLDNFLFDRSGFIHDRPISADLKEVMSSTAAYLNANPDRSLRISGHYQEAETYNGILPNLGMARANDIKQLLDSMGVAGGQIVFDAKMDKDLGFDENKLYGGLSYEFFPTPAAEDTRNLDAIRKRLQANPIILYFQRNDASLQLTAAQRKDFADIIYYLDRTPNGKVVSSGHSSTTGQKKHNQRLSRKRAEFVRDYISKNGIGVQKIEANGYGQSQPIGDNNTEEGRKQNRRVEVTLK